jgi:hypothetical protein
VSATAAKKISRDEIVAALTGPIESVRPHGGRTGEQGDASGFLDRRFNLACRRGHRSWAPTPELWAGHRCDREGCAAVLKAQPLGGGP